jgi:hypothetical protein
MSTLTPTATPTIGGRQKRKAVERLVIPTLQGRDYLPQGTVSYRPGHALEHNWTISEPNGAQHLVSCRIRTKPYGAFTVRYKTGTGRISELTKRVRSIAEGGNYPGFTIQAEMNEDATELHQAYVVRTDELYRHFVRLEPDGDNFTVHECTRKHPFRAPGGALFFVVAINEYGRNLAGTKSSLVACGVRVESLVRMDEALSLWRNSVP